MLYGFASRTERDCFELLLGAHGVGPALALAILSVHAPAELARVLADDDLAALCLVPGVGPQDGGPPGGRAEIAAARRRRTDAAGRQRRRAERPPPGGCQRILERVRQWRSRGRRGRRAPGHGLRTRRPPASTPRAAATGRPPCDRRHAAETPRSIVRQALAELGYGADETRRALAALDQDESLAGADERVLLRAALRRMGR